MSQISPPIRILVICAVALMAAWMLFLRPKAADVPAPAAAPNTQTGAPAASKPGKAAQGAQAAAAATNAQMAEEAANAGDPAAATTVKPGAAVPTKSVPAPGFNGKRTGLPLPVLKAVADKKVLVLLFWNPKSADDRAVRDAVRRVDRWGGEVFVKSAPIKTISRYGRITRGADVQQSPTVVVVDRKLKAETLVGYVDVVTIDQAVVDALRNSGPLFKSAYLRKVNALCSHTGSVSFAVADPNSAAQVPGFVSEQQTVLRRLDTRFAALKAPAGFRGFKRATVADHRAMVALLADWAAYVGSKPSSARVLNSVVKFGPRGRALGKRYDKRMDGRHLLSCGSNA